MREANVLYEFGSYRLDSAKRLLTHGSQAVALKPKTFDLLLLLVENHGRVLTKDELIKILWPDTFVEEGNLSFQVSILRKALSEEGLQWIETVPKHGYRFVASVNEVRESDRVADSLSHPVAVPPTAPEDHRSGDMPDRRTQAFGRRWIGAAIASGLLLAAAAAGVWRLNRSAMPTERVELVRLTSDPGLTTDPTISPDGRLLAYASDRAGATSLDIWVRQLNGGQEPIRLTDHETDDHEPTFSPDGNQIAFRSEREGGGIYVVPALGGQPRLLAKYGHRPRYSPDGAWVAYWVGSTSAINVSAHGSAKIFAIPTSGGEPRDLQPKFAAARYPVWSPDGKWVLFVGSREQVYENYYQESRNQVGDWYVAPIDGGPAQETGMFPMLKQQRLGAPLGAVQMAPSEWRDDRVTFSVTSGDSTNLWQVALPVGARSISAQPQRLTFGTGLEIQPALGTALPNEKTVPLVFASLTANMDIWSLPLRSDGFAASSEPDRLTEDPSSDFIQSLSPDGKRLLFSSNRTGKSERWMKNLENGRETLFFGKPGRSMFSADSSVVGYNTIEPDRPIFVAPVSGGTSERLCNDCGFNWHWSSDRKRVVYIVGIPSRIEVLDLVSSKRFKVLQHHEFDLIQPMVSPDDRWLMFSARLPRDRRRIFIAPFLPGKTIHQSDWIAATDGDRWMGQHFWSIEGNRLYFTSDSDGSRCIWGQELNPRTKHPVNRPFAVYHSHRARRSLNYLPMGFGSLAVSRDRVAFGQAELTGNIWMAKFPSTP